MPHTFHIRRLNEKDVQALQTLNRFFADAFEEPEMYLAHPPEEDYLRQWLANPLHVALVAFEGETVLGGLVAYELMKFEQRRSEFYIYDLAVAASKRRQGLATALIEDLKPIARQRQAWVIFVQADCGDEPAIALYSGLGEREDVLHFDIPVT